MTTARGTPLRPGGLFVHYVALPLMQVGKWFAWSSIKLAAYISLALLIGFTITTAWITFNSFRTNYSVETTDGVFRHSEDPMTTDIVNWLTDTGPIGDSIKLPLYRQYVKTIRENADMDIPDNFVNLGYPELNSLAIEWYTQKFPDATGSPEERMEIINNLFREAIRPPLEGFGPRVNERVWMVLKDAGAPRIRLIAEQDEYPSRIMAASASRGDEQAFYYPPEHTIYIRYNDSVRVLLNEAPHALQFSEHPYTSHWRLFGSLAESFWAGVANNANVHYEGEYRNPEALEGEAHDVIRDELLRRHGLSIVYDEAPAMLAPQHECVVPNPLESTSN